MTSTAFKSALGALAFTVLVFGSASVALSPFLPLWSVERSAFESAYAFGEDFTFRPVASSHFLWGEEERSLYVAPAYPSGSNLRVRVDRSAPGTLVTSDGFVSCFGWCTAASAEIIVQNEEDARRWRRWIEAEAPGLYENKHAIVRPERVAPPPS